MVVDKEEEYSRNAQVCVRLAKTTSNVEFKESWLKLAQAWMEMIPPQPSMEFEAATQAWGTGQTDSTASH